MELTKPYLPSEFIKNEKLIQKFDSLERLIEEFKIRDLPESISMSINEGIGQLNSFSGSPPGFLKLTEMTQSKILKTIEKELNIVPKNHF
jgi:hypothetical protein